MGKASKKSSNGNSTAKIVIAILLFVIVAEFVVFIFYYFENLKFLIILVLGITSFVIPLFLSFSPQNNLGTKLSKGEVRKSIVISLTFMYIILLSLSFVGKIEDSTTEIMKNFLYVYVVIIGFYFGSRLGERIKMLKELKNLKALDILQKRYAMGEIDDEVFGNTKSELEELERDEKKESEYQREVKFLQELVKNKKGKGSYDDYLSKLKDLNQQYGRNNPQNQKK